MAKYLRCHTAVRGLYNVGDRFEVINEDERSYYVGELGGYTKLPDDDGDSYATWFTLEDDAEPASTTTLPDESLGGVLREYLEVKRGANVGERIKIVASSRPNYPIGEVGVCTRNNQFSDGSIDTTLRFDGSMSDGFINTDIADYVVLEPTDIIVINSERLRMVDRKAAVGERVVVTKTAPNYTPFSVGEYGVVTGETGWVDADVNVDFGSKRYFIGPSASNSEYCVLEPAGPGQPTPALSDLPAQDQAAANIAALTLKVAELEKRADAAERRILALETETAPAYVEVASGTVSDALPSFAKSVAQGVVDAINDPEGTARRLFGERNSPQQIRDEIVERAKADVNKLAAGRRVTHIKYVVNREKRTVVALIVANASLRVVNRGIAKAAPGDVFNAHIGRSIALHRALGLEVPAEYLNAPVPTEVRVGDVVSFSSVRRYGTEYVVTSLNTHENNLRIVASSTSGMIGVSAYGEDLNAGKAIILDDSREDGGQSAASSALKGAV